MFKLIRDWRTTIAGGGSGVAGAIAILFPQYKLIFAVIFAILKLVESYYVKDKDATGGKIPMTEEAKARTTPEASRPVD